MFLISCTYSKTDYEQLPSVNFNGRVKLLVMHFTALDFADSVQVLARPDGLSSHYLIPESHDDSYSPRDIEIIQLVDETQRAWHAGTSFWQGRRMLNDTSIGIEIVNIPQCFKSEAHQAPLSAPIGEHDARRLCLFPDYDPKQIQLLIELSRDILARNPDIGPTQVVGHSDIAPTRKNDPGPRFPWFELYKAGIGAWYENETVDRYWQQFSTVPPPLTLLQKAFQTYGYEITNSGKMDTQTISVISAFQMHFLAHNVTGMADAQTAAVLFALLERYFPKQSEILNEQYQRYLAQSMHTSTVTSLPMKQSQYAWTPTSLNNQGTFKSYQGQGALVVENQNAEAVTIAINGETLNLTNPMKANTSYEYSLHRRTIDGLNRIKILNVEPYKGNLSIHVPYPTVSPQTKTKRSEFEAVRSLLQADYDVTNFPATISVIHRGKTHYQQTFGATENSHRFSGNGLTEDILLNFAVMKLVSEDKLDLSNAVFQYIRAFRGQGREQITVADLLGHTAGFPPEAHANFSPLMPLSNIPIIPNLTKHPAYSSYHYALLKNVVENISGMKFETYILEDIFLPLGLAEPYEHRVSINTIQILAQTLLNHGGYGQTALSKDYVLTDLTTSQRHARTWGYGWRKATFGLFASQASFGLIKNNGSFLFIDPDRNLAVAYFRESPAESNVAPASIINAIIEAISAKQ
nr:N-acetylmuramoyl-L-alanine amidase [Alteromonas sp. ASW11-130]